MRSSESIASLAPALVSAVHSVKGAPKDEKNPHFKNRFASLESVIESARDALNEAGLCVIQGPSFMEGQNLTVTTRIIHVSGEWIETDFQLPLVKMDPQAAGSAVTYARRYSLMAMLGIPAIDDDAEAAQGCSGGQETANEALPDFWGCEGPGPSAYQAKKDGLGEKHEIIRHKLLDCTTAADLRAEIHSHIEDIRKMPRPWRVSLREDCEQLARDNSFLVDRAA